MSHGNFDIDTYRRACKFAKPCKGCGQPVYYTSTDPHRPYVTPHGEPTCDWCARGERSARPGHLNWPDGALPIAAEIPPTLEESIPPTLPPAVEPMRDDDYDD